MSHELVHAFLEHNGPRRPLWLEEGLAEFYSTAELDSKGWIIGRAVENHVRVLNERAWLGEREFFEARPDSALREEGRRAGLFYAQAWAVVHYLLTTPGVREKALALFAAMGDGVPFARACESHLGMRQGLVLEAARRAVEQRRFLTARIAHEPDGAAISRPETIGKEEADAVLLSLALAVGQKLEPATVATAAQKGLLALGEGRRGEAEKWLEEALANGSQDPAAPFELAMLLREEKRAPERVAALLRQTIERNPNHAEAHFILGLQAEARGDVEGAIDYYQTAARILPRQMTFWHALALALERSKRLGEAAHAAMRCRLAAKNASEREMAAAVERLIREPAAGTAPRKPPVQVPESWRGLQGDTTVAGELVDFDCAATPPLATVGTGGGRLTLRLTRPNEIRITGTGAVRHTFACGAQRLKVRVEYQKATMELTAVEFQ
ncbi:MAG: DUF1570 domain-containing protein [Bryobacterales bacterium]|nr:DUF1570 domain-containing protein [Bryobacterales bacterium]